MSLFTWIRLAMMCSSSPIRCIIMASALLCCGACGGGDVVVVVVMLVVVALNYLCSLGDSGLKVRSIIGDVIREIEDIACWIRTFTIDSTLVSSLLSASEGLSLKNRSPKLISLLKFCREERVTDELADSEEESEKVVLGTDEGDQDESQAGPDPVAQAKDQTGSDAGAQDEGQAGSTLRKPLKARLDQTLVMLELRLSRSWATYSSDTLALPFPGTSGSG
nr:hypothetical protein [Tanacetum cinerariifolium]